MGADNYVPMYSSTTRGQEEIALFNLNCADMDIYEGQKSQKNIHVVKHINYINKS